MKIQPKVQPEPAPYVQPDIPEPTLDECDFPEDRPEPGEILEVRVIGVAKNSRYAYGDLDGRKIPILCPRRDGARQLRKLVRVQCGIDEANETTYTLTQ